ncbi:uncharacterized protein LOC133328348 [Musca vetustissima]|uniref:uncharacterized protein LOC133328348 n=1 Tax=Musca vetustissima TaxID=27455 RepID=UPI002AB7EA44|nr:uncharacterized protein LOC133328348 [Musca vetustissima]
MTSVSNKTRLWQSVFHLFYTLVLVNPMVTGSDEKSWTYEIKSLDYSTADEDILNTNLSVERVSRGVYALSGSIVLNIDIDENTQCYVEASTYRSDNGVNEYKVLAFKMSRQNIISAINGFYKEMFMDTLSECSDLPVFEDKFEPPIEKREYTLTKCQFSQDGFPNHLEEGFYKILISGSGCLDWHFAVIVEVEATN